MSEEPKPADLLKVKKPKRDPLEAVKKLRIQAQKEFDRIDKRFKKPTEPKNGLRAKYTEALVIIAKSNLDPLISISAANLGIHRSLFSGQTLLEIIEKGSSAEVQKICLKRLIEETRNPQYKWPNQIGEKSYLFGLLLKIPDELKESELEMIKRETSSPIQKAIVQVYLEKRGRMRDDDESEYES